MFESEGPLSSEVERRESSVNRGGSIVRHILEAPVRIAAKVVEALVSSKKTS